MPDLLKRRSYSCTLETVTPLHLGSGDVRDDLLPEIEVTRNGVRETRKVAVAAIQRDNGNCPTLPGTALKGALRRNAPDGGEALFGNITEKKKSPQGQEVTKEPARMGALLLRGARWLSGGDGTGLPFAGNATFVHARSKIDPGRGTSDSNKLFHAEMVIPKSRFEWHFRLETRGDIDRLEEVLLKALAPWAEERGIAIGANKSADLGRVRLVEGTLKRTDWHVEGGRLVARGEAQTLPLSPSTDKPDARLTLLCKGPFLTLDTDVDPPEDDDTHTPQLRALRHQNAPFVLATMVKGALRQRLSWLLACDAFDPDATPPSQGETVIRDPSETHRLSAVERLFGAAGWRGVLRVAVTETAREAAVKSSQVRIDRFSGGTVDSALFTIDADRGVRLELSFWLDAARAETRDRDNLARVLDDIRENGLELGHGVTKGYGWFRVEEN